MQENLGSKLDFVIDFTEASLFDIICTIMILLSVGNVVGQQGMNNVNKIFVLNPSFYVRLVLQKYMSYCESFEQILSSVHDRIVICDSIKKLQAYVPDCSIALPLETKRFIDSISMVYQDVSCSANFLEKSNSKVLLAQNADGIIIMYPTQMAMQTPESKKENSDGSHITYCSQDFYTYESFKLYVYEEQTQSQSGKLMNFSIVQSFPRLNNFATLSENNILDFIKECAQAVKNRNYQNLNFGIEKNQQLAKKIINMESSSKTIRNLVVAITRIQNTLSQKLEQKSVGENVSL